MHTEIVVYKDINSELKNIWLELEKRSHNHCFQSLSWIFYLISFFKKNNIFFLLQVIVVKKDTEVVAIFPFWIINLFGFKVLQWIGNDFSDYNGPILSNDYNYNETEFLKDFNSIKKKNRKI